jgi:acyl carrier protein
MRADQKINQKLKQIFCEVFGRDIELSLETTAAEVEGWDSLTHITLISAVEEAFGMNFTMAEILEMKNVGEMIEIIKSRIS